MSWEVVTKEIDMYLRIPQKIRIQWYQQPLKPWGLRVLESEADWKSAVRTPGHSFYFMLSAAVP